MMSIPIDGDEAASEWIEFARSMITRSKLRSGKTRVDQLVRESDAAILELVVRTQTHQ